MSPTSSQDVCRVLSYDEAASDVDRLPDQKCLVQVHHISQKERKKLNGRQHECVAQIMDQTGTFLPRDASDMTLNICLYDEQLGPALRLTLSLQRKRTVKHVAQFDFHFCPLFPPVNIDGRTSYSIPKTGIIKPKLSWNENESEVTLTFTSEYGVVTNGWPSIYSNITEDELRDDEVHIITLLMSVCAASEGRRITLHLSRCSLTAADKEAFKTLPSMILNPPSSARAGFYAPYMDATGHTAVQYGDMLGPKELLKKNHQYYPVAAMTRFPDYRAALISLAYGCQAFHDENCLAAEALHQDKHSIKVYRLQTSMLVLAVTFNVSATSANGPPLTPSPGSIAKAAVYLNHHVRADVTGIVPDQLYNIQCDMALVVLSRNRGTRLLENHGAVTEYGSKQPAKSFKSRISLIISDQVVKQQINAVRMAFDPTLKNGLAAKLLPSLNRNYIDQSEQEPLSDSFQEATAKTKFKSVFNAWVRDPANNFSAEQRRALRSMDCMIGTIHLLQGPGGCGKSHLMLELARFLITKFPGQFKVVLASQTHAVLDELTTKWVQQDSGDISRVLRTAAPSKTGLRNISLRNAIRNEHDAPDATDEELNEFRNLALFTSKRSMRGRSLPEYTAEGHVMDLITTKEPVMGQFQEKVDNRLVNVGDAVNMTAVLTPLLAKLVQTPFAAKDDEGKDVWTEEERKKLKRAFTILMDHVVAKAGIMIGTVHSMQARTFREFGANCQAIVYMVDEAPSIAEASCLIPLSSAFWSPKINLTILAGDMTQVCPAPVTTKCNLFEAQMQTSQFERLHVNDAACSVLNEQRRIHPTVLDPANRLFYRSKLKPIGEHPPLPDEFASTMMAHFKWNKTMQLTEVQQRLSWFALDGHVRRADNTSKVNFENLYFTQDHLLPMLKAIYGDEVCKKVAIITPYAKQKDAYLALLYRLQTSDQADRWTREELPDVMTIDESRGTERFHVIVDLVVTDVDKLGFMDSKSRACLAFTRAQGVLWVVGGAMDQDPLRRNTIEALSLNDESDELEVADRNPSYLLTYKRLLSRRSCTYYFSNIRRPNIMDLPVDLMLTVEESKAADARSEYKTAEEWRAYVVQYLKELAGDEK